MWRVHGRVISCNRSGCRGGSDLAILLSPQGIFPFPHVGCPDSAVIESDASRARPATSWSSDSERVFMTNRSLVVGCIATLSLVAAVAAQTGAQQSPPATPPATSTPAAGARAQTAAPQQA